MRRLPPDSERPSRTRRKLAAEAAVELAHQLAALPEVAFRGVPLPPELFSHVDQQSYSMSMGSETAAKAKMASDNRAVIPHMARAIEGA